MTSVSEKKRVTKFKCEAVDILNVPKHNFSIFTLTLIRMSATLETKTQRNGCDRKLSSTT